MDIWRALLSTSARRSWEESRASILGATDCNPLESFTCGAKSVDSGQIHATDEEDPGDSAGNWSQYRTPRSDHATSTCITDARRSADLVVMTPYREDPNDARNQNIRDQMGNAFTGTGLKTRFGDGPRIEGRV